jgi:hypothetical protein
MMVWTRCASVVDCAIEADAPASSKSDSKAVVTKRFIGFIFTVPGPSSFGATPPSV